MPGALVKCVGGVEVLRVMGEPWASNQRRLVAAAESVGFKGLVLAGEANLVYTLGVKMPSGALVLSGECGNIWLVPLLDYHRALSLAPGDFEVKAFYRGGEALKRVDVPRGALIEASNLGEALKAVLGDCSGLGADLEWLQEPAAAKLREHLGVGDASSVVSRVRSVKSPEEADRIEEAQRIAEEALGDAIDSLGEGVSEEQAAAVIECSVRRRGAWREAFPSIAAFYSNTAYPHHQPTATTLGHPGPVLFDLGAVVDGYHSDLTRTLWWGGSTPSQFREVLEAVEEALGEAADTVAPGVEARDVDAAARRVLERRGLARFFIHGTGHGVGVEIHEKPYLRPGSQDVLEPGMIVTVEPGVYIAGRFGVRIEDLVLVTKRGRRVLTRIARILPGV